MTSDLARTAIKVTKLAKRYGTTEAVRGINLEVREGEIFGLIGPDGAGKTSTFQILAGIMEATSGTAEVFDEPARETRSHTGYLTQTFSLYPDLTVMENIRYIGDLRRVPHDQIYERGPPLSGHVRHGKVRGPPGRTVERRHEAEAVPGLRSGARAARAVARRAHDRRRSRIAP